MGRVSTRMWLVQPQLGCFQQMARGILAYAGSSVLTSLSAGLYVAAETQRISGQSSLASALGTAGLAFLGGGVVLAFAAIAMLTSGFVALRKVEVKDSPDARRISLGVSTFFAGSASLVVGAPLLLWGTVLGRPSQLFFTGAGLTFLSGILYILAIAFTGFSFMDFRSRTLLLLASVAGMAGLFGEFMLLLDPAGPRAEDWATFGGVPLLNVNLPLGVVVAGSAFLFWASYRRILKGKLAARNESDAVTSG